jgi:hypothetical protein
MLTANSILVTGGPFGRKGALRDNPKLLIVQQDFAPLLNLRRLD